MTEQDTGKYRQNTKDQYFTREHIAKKCVGYIYGMYNNLDTYEWIEPSAGNGVFLRALPESVSKIGIDIDPKGDNILQGDYLKWKPSTDVKKRIVFGNPPFGRQSSLAKAFIKHSAKYADIIAFILPKSFVKPSMFNAFPLQFHCMFNIDVDNNAFEVNGQLYNVPCVFQIWEKKESNRVVEAPTKEIGFNYVKYGTQCDIVCKRVGGLAGKCYGWRPTAAVDFHKEYHYFIKLDEKYLQYTGDIIDKINLHIFPSNTVGPRSLSKSEINIVVNQILHKTV